MKKLLLITVLLLTSAAMFAQNSTQTREKKVLTIKYLYAADLAEAAPDSILKFNEGETYKIISPEITGFTPDKDKVEGTMPDHDVTDTVLYSPKKCQVTTVSEPEGAGTLTGAGSYDYGSNVKVTATANEGYAFMKWTKGDEQVSTNHEYTFTVTRDVTLTAHFEEHAGNTHTVSIDPLIEHGNVSVSPEGEVEVGTQVTITATPDANYGLESLSAYKKDDASQTVSISGNVFVMPDFDVMVSATFILNALPVIDGDIVAPAAICAGGTLDLTAPEVSNYDDMAWQMAPNAEFAIITVYDGQALDGTYNGWKLRLMASNASGTVYSNVVSIVVNDLSNLTLTGESFICSGQEARYEIVGSGNFNLEWTSTDANAIITTTGKTAKIKWGTAGNMTLTVVAEEPESGCSTEVEMTVKVQSYINSADIQNIVAKKQNGKPYLLIYPNPKDDYKYQWYKDGEAIEGANGQYYYPAEGLAAGNYQVYISYNADAQGNLFCGAFSPVFAVSDAAFAIYPNPASANEPIVVLIDNDSEAVISIYNMEGQLVHQQMSQGYETKISAQLAQGVYVIRVSNGNAEKTEKIIIK